MNESPAFEVPLASVSQCATGKNEVTVEFHQNDDAEVSLMEVRFYVPPTTGDEGSDPVEVSACSCVRHYLTVTNRGHSLQSNNHNMPIKQRFSIF